MNKKAIISMVIGLVLGIGGTLGVGAMTNTQKTTTTDHGAMSMVDMNKELVGKTGDEFDKAFIEMMIAHHKGAVDMAELIPSRAKHDEIKKLGKGIIEAQTKEIADMQKWQLDWGYISVDSSMPGMNH